MMRLCSWSAWVSQVTKALSALIRFQMKTELFCSVFKKICVHTLRLRIVFACPHYNGMPVLKMLLYLSAHGSICPPFWTLTVEWSGARSCLFWWRHHFQIASFSPSTLENSIIKKHCFQIASLWRVFLNGSVFGDHFWHCSVDDSRIQSKTALFSFENGLVWMGPNICLWATGKTYFFM